MVNIYEAGPFEGRLGQWPVLAVSGALEVRLAETELEIEQAQRLRYTVFYEEMNAVPSPQMRESGRDFDKYDAVCDHLLVVDRDTHDEDGQPLVVGTYRLTRKEDANRVGGFYTSSEYDLAPMLRGLPQNTKYLELGRSCILKSYRARPGTMQLLWKGLMAYAARFDIDVMFGCASLPGANPLALALPLSFLHHQASAGAEWQAAPRNGRFVPMGILDASAIDMRKAVASLPPLVKAYLRVGAKFSDGAVIDRQFGTVDVFTVMPLTEIEPRYIAYFGSPADLKESAAA